jgi:LmbE family N-acetylglucosaminyl deacetylase
MARLLYVFPHPDDESFGPGPIIARQRREGHEVFLLTLTKGEATSQREKYGYSKAKMGAVREAEMQNVAQALALSGMTVLDFPDGRLDALDPLRLEEVIAAHIQEVEPDVVVTYAVHGISGHPDHLVTHAVVKRVYCALRAQAASYLRRLAFFTLPEADATNRPGHLRGSPPEHIDCVVPFEDVDLERAHAALDCYVTYQAVVEAQRPLDHVADGVHFTFFQEEYGTVLSDLTAQLDPVGV